MFEMEFDAAEIKLAQDLFDAWFDRSIVRAIAGHKFFDNGSQCLRRQLQMGDSHRVSLPRYVRASFRLTDNCISPRSAIADAAWQDRIPSNSRCNQKVVMSTNGVTSFKQVAAKDEQVLLACNNRRFVFAGRSGTVMADRSTRGQVTAVRMALDFASDLRRAGGDAMEGCPELLTKYFPEEFVVVE